ncbi:MAG: hypothetical protein AAFR52_14195, partial [Pseudomonadota bacterium]
MGNADARALAPRGTAPQARHPGGQPGLVDEDQAFRVQVRLRLEPGDARRGDVRAVLLAGLGGLLPNDQPCRRKKRCIVDGAKRSPCSRQPLGGLDRRDVRRLCHHREDRGTDRLDAARPRVAAPDVRRERTAVPPAPMPCHRRRGSDAEPGCGG